MPESGLHEQIQKLVFAQVLGPYEVTLSEFALIKRVLFARGNVALGSLWQN